MNFNREPRAMPIGPAVDLPVPPPIAPEQWLNPGQWGMLSFLLSEVAFFSTLIVAYVTFRGVDQVGPLPGEVLSLPLVVGTTVCLLASSLTVHVAASAWHNGATRRFLGWWALTIALGVVFLLGTAYEWRELIVEHRLTISRNLFGSTYYTLVGFHALHVTVGVLVMLLVLGLALTGKLGPASDTIHRSNSHAHDAPGQAVHLVAWYWHFVDVVWVVVFAVVYL